MAANWPEARGPRPHGRPGFEFRGSAARLMAESLLSTPPPGPRPPGRRGGLHSRPAQYTVSWHCVVIGTTCATRFSGPFGVGRPRDPVAAGVHRPCRPANKAPMHKVIIIIA